MRTAPRTPKAGSILVSKVTRFDEGDALAVAVGNVETIVVAERTVEGGMVEPLDTDADTVRTGTLVTNVVVAFCAQADPSRAARTSATSMVGSEVALDAEKSKRWLKVFRRAGSLQWLVESIGYDERHTFQLKLRSRRGH
jgi:sporulation-control protein spo0M